MQELICMLFGHKIVKLEKVRNVEIFWRKETHYEFYCQRCGKRIG